MTSFALIAAAAAILLLLLALKLRGPRGGRDLTGPPRGKPFSRAEAARLAELVDRGEEAEARRLIRAAGYDEASARRVVGLIRRLAGPPPPAPARTEPPE